MHIRDTVTNRSRPALLALALLVVAALPAATAQAAPPPLLRQICSGGAGAGQCTNPRGMAVDPASGNVYLADLGNSRIDEFTAWGEFVRAWGWDVVATGPDDDTTPPQNQLETCIPANGDVCKAGIEVPFESKEVGAGQFGYLGPAGLALDGAGDLYAIDGSITGGAHRVQKFAVPADPKAPVSFALMFGGEVNKTKTEAAAPEAERNLCPVDPGDICQVGSTGAGKGQFAEQTDPGFGPSSNIATSPDGETIYVGDRERVQEFDTGGHYLTDLPDPEGLLAGETVGSLAIDPDGNVYLGFFLEGSNKTEYSKDDVLKLDPAGSEACTLKVPRVSAIAVDAVGQVHVVSAALHGTPPIPMQIVSFDAESCTEVGRFNAKDEGFEGSRGIATSSACGIEGADLLISNNFPTNSFVRLYGPPPQDLEACPPPAAAPSIEASYAASVGATGATVQARINPHFWPDTAYYVQYGTGKCSEGGCEEEQPLPPGATLTAEVKDASIASAGVFLGGLSPDTTYRFRFVAKSGGGGPVFGEEASFHTFPHPPKAREDCPNQAFRSAASAPLPDCRAYELVSPVDKNGGDVLTTRDSFSQAAADGQRMTFSSYTAFAGAEGSPLVNQYLSQRDPGGWSTRSISTPRESYGIYPPGGADTPQYKAFDEELCNGWVLQGASIALAPGAPAGMPNVYRRGLCAPEGYELLTPVPPPGFGLLPGEIAPGEYFPEIQGFSADGSRSVFRADAELTADACTELKGGKSAGAIFQLYMAHGGQLRLVSVLPNGKAACVHSSAGTAIDVFGQFRRDSVEHAVSSDGSRVFWSTSATTDSEIPASNGGQNEQPGPLYLRLNPEGEQAPGGECKGAAPGQACTIAISTAKDTRFWDADPKGATALYTSGEDLFEFDVAEEKSTRIAKKGVRGVMGASEDLSGVYFVSTAVLTGKAQNSEGDAAIAERPNLYLFENGAPLRFVATLSSSDAVNTVTDALPSPIALAATKRAARVTPDGLRAAFFSTAAPTGADTADVQSGEPDGEVYLYDASASGGAGKLACISCNPSGARPAGREIARYHNDELSIWAAAELPGWRSPLSPGHPLSDDGQRLFFQSTDALVLRDTNGRRDVYEWQRGEGQADCENKGAELYVASAAGCLSLISSGQSPQDAELLDASASGSDVFFTTAASLLAYDPGLVDVYDARSGGGLPPPPSPQPECEGQACQPPSVTPQAPNPASATFAGAGNGRQASSSKPRCPKGKARRRGRCVKRGGGAHRRPTSHERGGAK